jgi:hypothetical protein
MVQFGPGWAIAAIQTTANISVACLLIAPTRPRVLAALHSHELVIRNGREIETLDETLDD